jgi:zinc transporter ZupT
MGSSHHDHDHKSEGSSQIDTLMGLKIALIIILFLVCYLGLIPAYSNYCRNNKLTLSLMNCFAGGVFLSMAFVHILPESVELYFDSMTGASHGHDHRLRMLQSISANKTVVAEPE